MQKVVMSIRDRVDGTYTRKIRILGGGGRTRKLMLKERLNAFKVALRREVIKARQHIVITYIA